MRIEPNIKKKLITFLSTQKNILSPAKIWVFGSRVDPKKKGGDIDLLFSIENPEKRKTFKMQKYKFITKLESIAGEQKIDLVITTEEKISLDPFLKTLNRSLLIELK